MAAIDWLVDPFPQVPQADSFDWSPPETVHHFGVDQGPVISWETSLAAPRTVPMVFWLTRAEAIQFETWYRDTIKRGLEPFNFPHPILQDGSTYEAKILKKYSLTSSGGDLFDLAVEITELQAQ